MCTAACGKAAWCISSNRWQQKARLHCHGRAFLGSARLNGKTATKTSQGHSNPNGTPLASQYPSGEYLSVRKLVRTRHQLQLQHYAFCICSNCLLLSCASRHPCPRLAGARSSSLPETSVSVASALHLSFASLLSPERIVSCRMVLPGHGRPSEYRLSFDSLLIPEIIVCSHLVPPRHGRPSAFHLSFASLPSPEITVS